MGASWGEAKPRAHFCHTAPGPDKNTWQPRSMKRGVWEGRGWLLLAAGWLLSLLAVCCRCWLAVVGMAGGGGLLAGWLALGWLRVVVLKVGERLAGGTLARVYNASTGLYGAL